MKRVLLFLIACVVCAPVCMEAAQQGQFSITPSSGIQGGTIAVSVTGSGFVAGQTQLTANRNGVLVQKLRVLDDAHLNALLALDASPGLTELRVITPQSTSDPLPFEIKPGPLNSATSFRVDRVAGSSKLGSADGVGSEAGFYHPNFLWGDGRNLYVSENQAVRKIDLATARVTTLAGVPGAQGFVDGPATEARFNLVQGIWADNASVYVLDDGNGAVRKIDLATGNVTTLARDLRPDSFDGPGGNGFWGDGTFLYVTRRNVTHSLLRIEIATGSVTTAQVPGLRYPQALSGDSANLYLVDAATLLQISIATGEVETIADLGPAETIWQDAAAFYFSTDGSIRRLDRSTGAITTIAGDKYTLGATDGIGPAARFQIAKGIWGNAGQLYVADYANNAIRRITIATGEVTTFAGSITEHSMIDGDASTARFAYLQYITSDGLNIYASDTGSVASPLPAIRKINIATGQVSTLAQTGARSMWTDGEFLYYSVRSLNAGGEIRKVNLATGETTVLTGKLFGGDLNPIDGPAAQARFPRPDAIWGDGDSLFVADWVLTQCVLSTPSCIFPSVVRSIIRRISLASGDVTTLVTEPLTNEMTGLMWGDSSYLYLPQFYSIKRVALRTGAVTDLDVTPTTTPTGIWGDGSYLYLANQYQHSISRIELATGILTTVISPDAGQFVAPGGIWGDGAHLYVADSSAIRKVSTDGSQISDILSRSFDLVNRGGIALDTGSAGALKAGYAKVQMDTGAVNPSGVAIFEYRPGGVTVTEAAVPASPLVQAGRIYVEIDGPANTGIAFANPNDQPATVSFFFTNAAGTNFGAATMTVPPKGHVSRFLNEAPFSPGASVRDARSFTFSSSAPIAALALRGYTNERSDFLITTLPVAAIGEASAQPLFFPHFADGGGWSTQVVLVNPTDAQLTGTVRFGTNALPYSIAPRSSTKLQTAGTGTTVNVGSIQVTPDSSSLVPSGVVIFSFKKNDITVSETGVPSVAPAQAFRTYVENSGMFGAASSLETGLAIANPSQSAVMVSLDLFALNGQLMGSRGTLTVAAVSQIPLFLTEVPAFKNLAPGFEGIIRISTDSPDGISVIALRGHYNERGDFLVATMPVVPENASPSPSPLFFPHIVEGGGYTTKVVLFSGTDAQQGTVSIQGEVVPQ